MDTSEAINAHPAPNASLRHYNQPPGWDECTAEAELINQQYGYKWTWTDYRDYWNYGEHHDWQVTPEQFQVQVLAQWKRVGFGRNGNWVKGGKDKDGKGGKGKGSGPRGSARDAHHGNYASP